MYNIIVVCVHIYTANACTHASAHVLYNDLYKHCGVLRVFFVVLLVREQENLSSKIIVTILTYIYTVYNIKV
jgi:hypothetical protein